MTIALLTAAGMGSRMHMDIPKQFLTVENKPIIIHTLEIFEASPQIDSIIVVTLEAWREILLAYAKQYNITKLKWVVKGGDSGHESIYNGLMELEKYCGKTDTVILHDGNRPMISTDLIADSLAVFYEYGNAVAAIPCIEAIFKSENRIYSDEIIQREQLLRTQTPHTFSLGKLLWAYETANKENITNTVAACDLMQRLGERIYFSRGSEKNLKLTTQEDLEILSLLLKNRNKG